MKTAKKALFLFTAVILSVFSYACTRKNEESKTPGVSNAVSETDKDLYRLGFAVLHESSAEKAEYDATFAAVVTDARGKIVKCVIDQLEAQADTANITAETGKEFPTKSILGDEYSMKNASPIGKEWYEQAEAFESYCIGKTISEIENSVGEDGKIADLSASCTVNAVSFAAAVTEAVKNAKSEFSAENKDDIKLGLSVNCTLSSSSKESTDTESGKAVFSCTVSAAAVDGNNKIYRTYIDETECEISFAPDGSINAGDGNTPVSKQELGKDYGMKAASKIGKEWNEQADAFAEYCMGKTGTEVTGAVDEDGKVPDLSASCTVYSASFAESVANAVENAK